MSEASYTNAGLSDSQPPHSGSEAGEPVTLHAVRLLTALWHDRAFLLKVIAAGTLLSIGIALAMRNVYTSNASLMPPDNSSNVGLSSLLSSASGAAAASAGSSLLGVKTPSALFVAILGSHSVRADVVQKFDLLHRYGVRYEYQAEKVLGDSTQVAEDPKSGVIRIAVESRDPALSQGIAQEYIHALDHTVTHNSTSQAGRERTFLEERLVQIRQDLETSSKALSQFSTKSRTFDLQDQAKGTVDASLKLQAELLSARSEEAALRESYSDGNVRVRAASARVAELQRALNQMIGSSRDNSDGQAEDAASGSASSKRQEYPSLDQLPGLGVTYADLSRKVKVEELLWETLTRQYEAAKVQEAKEIPSVRTLDAPTLPEHKSAPPRTLIILFGMVFSALLAAVLVQVRRMWAAVDGSDERKRLLQTILQRGHVRNDAVVRLK